MGWIKEANKKGRYERTYEGFRIYVVVEPTSTESIVEKDGELWNSVKFTRGDYYATDSTGLTYTGWRWDVIGKIDKEIFRRKLSKKYGEELDWKF